MIAVVEKCHIQQYHKNKVKKIVPVTLFGPYLRTEAQYLPFWVDTAFKKRP